MFCSIECRDEFYKYADLSPGHINKFAFLLEKIAATFGGQEKLNKFINKHSSTSIFDFDFSDPHHPDYLLNICKCFLSAHPSCFAKEIEELDWGKKDLDATTDRLLRLLLGNFIGNSISTANVEHKGITYDESKYSIRLDQMRTSLDKQLFSTFRALLNHSCVPNVDFFCIENTVIFYVKEPIKANEQLFISYM
jgi:hypothetical protein